MEDLMLFTVEQVAAMSESATDAATLRALVRDRRVAYTAPGKRRILFTGEQAQAALKQAAADRDRLRPAEPKSARADRTELPADDPRLSVFNPTRRSQLYRLRQPLP